MAITASDLQALLDQVKSLVQQLEGLVAREKAEEEATARGLYPTGRLTRRA